jgi:hypothetical protein
MSEKNSKVTVRIYDDRVEADMCIVGAAGADSICERRYFTDLLRSMCADLGADLLLVDHSELAKHVTC